MSRILRRPMFRGGRVDSRGTGIASGLGYEKGGRVGYEMGGNIRGGIVNLPGGYNKTADQRRLDLFKENLAKTKLDQPGSTIYDDDTLQQMWNKFKSKMYTGDPAQFGNLDLAYGMQIAPPVGIDEQNFESFINQYGDEEAFKLWKTGKMPGFEGEDYIKLQEDQRKIYPEKFGKVEEDPLTEEETRAAFEERIRRENAEELQALIESRMGKGTPEEEIEKNKAIFQKAYGSGVPEDASRMLLSAASRLLEPEATVKSGLGKFFGDESKVESKRGKYKDAATTAAINAYLTGQSSFKKFEDELGLYSKKLGMKTKADKATLQDMTIGQHKATISGAGKSDSQLTKAATENYIASQPEDKGKILNTFSSKKDPIEKLLVEENVNEYFMDGDTKQIFKIIKIGDEITFDRLY